MKTKRMISAALTFLGLVAIAAFSSCFYKARLTFQAGKPEKTVSSLTALLALPIEALQEMDVAKMNLLCAQSLRGSEDLDVNQSLTRLDEMAARVRSETERHSYRFQRNPPEFENSEGYFRMIMLAVVLAEDFQVRYTPDKIGSAADARLGDEFFGNAHDVFLHGLTGPKPQGTCSSLPVLQVAIGRRLGYPLKLVTTKGHLFVRWEDSRERFNIEAAGKGVNRFPDDYYRHWPLEVTEREIQAEGYRSEQILQGVLYLIMAERELKSPDYDCETSGRRATRLWDYAWELFDYRKQTKTVPPDNGTKPITAADHTSYVNSYGLRIRCNELATYFNGIRRGKFCNCGVFCNADLPPELQ